MIRPLARLQAKVAMLPSFAAAMSFYFVVSLIPFLIVVSRTVAWLFSANLLPELAGLLRDVLPPESSLRPEALSASVMSSDRGLGLVSTLVAAWTASSGLNEMARAVHYVFSDDRSPHPGGWVRRLKSIGLLAIWTVAFGAAAVFLVFVPVLHGTFSGFGSSARFPAAFSATVRYPGAFALLFGAFSLTYAYIPQPQHRPTWRAACAGGLAAAASWMGVCFVFAYFLPQVWRVSLFHGVLSSALATLIWAYCGCWGVIVGACFAAALRES
jgi:membrane protein